MALHYNKDNSNRDDKLEAITISDMLRRLTLSPPPNSPRGRPRPEPRKPQLLSETAALRTQIALYYKLFVLSSKHTVKLLLEQASIRTNHFCPRLLLEIWLLFKHCEFVILNFFCILCAGLHIHYETFTLLTVCLVLLIL